MGNQQLTADMQIRLLQVELAKAKAEATHLRKKLGENARHAKRIHRAYDDALLMIFWRSVGIKPSRRFAARYDINQYRWENALGLLRMARLVQGRSRWVSMDIAVAESRLTAARDKALLEPDLFFLRMNCHHNR